MDNKIKDIYNIYSVSSFERQIGDYLQNHYKKNGYKIVKDNLGSIFFNKENKGKEKVMIAFKISFL